MCTKEFRDNKTEIKLTFILLRIVLIFYDDSLILTFFGFSELGPPRIVCELSFLMDVEAQTVHKKIEKIL